MLWTEILGYVASVLVAASLVMVSFVRLRIINLSGAVTFVAYGILIGSIPIVITNAFIAIVNVYHLTRIFRADLSGFSYVPIDAGKRNQLDDFLKQYREDVLRFYPRFALDFLESAFSGGGQVYLAVRNLRVEGFAYYVWLDAVHGLGEQDEELSVLLDYMQKELYPSQTVYLPVDYVTVKYRDLGLVTKLHEQLVHDIAPEAKFMVSITERSRKRTTRFFARSGHILARQTEHYRLYVKTLE